MENRMKGAGASKTINRSGPITSKEIEQIVGKLNREVVRLTSVAVGMNVLKLSEIEVDGVSKFRKGATEITKAVDNLLRATRPHLPPHREMSVGL